MERMSRPNVAPGTTSLTCRRAASSSSHDDDEINVDLRRWYDLFDLRHYLVYTELHIICRVPESSAIAPVLVHT